MKSSKFIKDVIWSVEDLETLEKFYKSEYERTKEEHFKSELLKIEEYLNQYKEMLGSISSSIELRLYKYLKQGYTPTQAVQKVADENYMSDIKPNSLSHMWIYYKNLKKCMNNSE